jgi:two-component system NtrC family sensor kinase
VAEHEGRIYAEARPHSGTRFVIELPARAAPSAASEPVRESGAVVPEVPRGKRVLLIDDEPDIRRSISKFLSRSGWDVLLAESGEEGLRLIEVGDFDAVLCDLRMPGMSGHEFYRRIVASGSAMVERLVFMTGDVMSPEAQNFLSAAGRPALSKPFTLPELVAALSRVTTA